MATGVDENSNAAKAGGKIAKNARVALEDKTGKPVVSSQNYLAGEAKSKITRANVKKIKPKSR